MTQDSCMLQEIKMLDAKLEERDTRSQVSAVHWISPRGLAHSHHAFVLAFTK